MIELETELEGKRTYYRNMLKHARDLNYTLGSSWDYEKGCIDSILWQEGGETIYLRLPFKVVKGELEHPKTLLEFGKPFVIKHVVNLGIDTEFSGELATVTGLAQFQKPLDRDGLIHDKNEWKQNGEKAVNRILDKVQFLQ